MVRSGGKTYINMIYKYLWWSPYSKYKEQSVSTKKCDKGKSHEYLCSWQMTNFLTWCPYLFKNICFISCMIFASFYFILHCLCNILSTKTNRKYVISNPIFVPLSNFIFPILYLLYKKFCIYHSHSPVPNPDTSPLTISPWIQFSQIPFLQHFYP